MVHRRSLQTCERYKFNYDVQQDLHTVFTL